MVLPSYFYFWAAPMLTVILETAFFALVGYRKRDFLLLCVAVNVATNLALNMAVYALFYEPLAILIGELLVVALEYLAYALVLGRSKKLFLLTLAANAISYLAGGLLYGFV